MKLSVIRGGGLAGMVKRTELASDALSAEDADTLHRKVEEAGLLESHEEPRAEPAHADELTYEVTIEQEGRHRTVRATESAMPEAVRALVEWADSVPEGKTTIQPPGGGRRGAAGAA
jgi:Emfourin